AACRADRARGSTPGRLPRRSAACLGPSTGRRRSRTALLAAAARMVAADGRAAVRLKAAPTSAADARAHARAILREHRFQRSHPPRPFKRPLHWLGDRLHTLAEHTPGGRWTLRDLFAAAVLAAATVVAVRLARRRTG